MKTITQFKSIESFSTERLIALKITANELDRFVAICSTSEVMEDLGGIPLYEKILDNFNWHLLHWKENGFGLWLFFLKETMEWVGNGGLYRIEINKHSEIEIGYALLPKFWGQGYGTEIAKACSEIGFEVLRHDKIVCLTSPNNKASQRVMEKIGFKYERDIIHADRPHVLYLMKNPRKVEIVPYDPKWFEFFNHESCKLRKALGDYLREIYHIGSTAIPNMPAKPVIDIMLVSENLDKIDDITQKLNSLNYYNIRRHVIPHQSFFVRRQDEEISFHLHIHEMGSPQINRHVNFRDYVINHPEDARAYAALKMKLAEKFTDNMNAYVFGKDKLVQEIDTRAKLWSGRKDDYLPANRGPATKEWSQEKLIKAIGANLNVHMTHFAQYLNQIELIRIPGCTIVNSGLPDDTFNYVLDADFSKAEANKKIHEVTNYFLQKNIPFSWWVSPYDKPEDLPNNLENNGYVNTENNTAMYFDLDAWDGNISSIPELQIVQAKDERTLRDFAMVLSHDKASFKKYFKWIASILTDDDPIEFYVGYINDKPVVRGLSCYFAQVAGLHWLSTAPNEHKKGYGKAMQGYRLKRAKELGYHIAVLQASHEGYSLYKKLGYKECGTFREFKLRKNNHE